MAVGASAAALDLKLFLFSNVVANVLLHLALVLQALTLGAEIREQRVEAGAEALLLGGGVGH